MAMDVLSQLFENPLSWVIFVAFIAVFIYYQYHREPKDPSQEIDFGIKIRKKRVKENMDQRDKLFSIKPKNAYLYRDVFKLGKIKSVEEIPQTKLVKKKDGHGGLEKSVRSKDTTIIYSFVIKPCGFWHELLDLFGFGHQRIVVDDENIQSVFDDRSKEIHYKINKDIFFRIIDGVFVLSGNVPKNFIDEINLMDEMSNLKGYLADFVRKVSGLDPRHSELADLMEVKAAIDEKKEDRKRRGYGA